MKKTIAIVAALFVAIVFIPAADIDATGSDNGLWVNAVQVTGDTNADGWSYVASTNTLTLNGAVFNGDGYHRGGSDSRSASIYDGRGGTLNIVLNGTNVITAMDGESGISAHGIFSTADISISGTGSLLIESNYVDGIYVGGGITVSGGTTSIHLCTGHDLRAIGGFNMTGGTLNLMDNAGMQIGGAAVISGGAIHATNTSGIDAIPFPMNGLTMTGGSFIITNNEEDGRIILSESGFNLEGAQLVNLIPKKNGTECPIGEANALYSNTADDVAIVFPSSPRTVTFDANGGDCAIASMVTDDYGLLASLPDATRDGYGFDGWFTAADGGDKVSTSTVFDTDATVYAHWSKEGNNNLPMIIVGIIVGVVVVGIAAFLLLRKH